MSYRIAAGNRDRQSAQHFDLSENGSGRRRLAEWGRPVGTQIDIDIGKMGEIVGTTK